MKMEQLGVNSGAPEGLPFHAPLVAPIAHIQVIPSYMYPAPLVAPIAHIQVIPSYMYI